MHFQYVDVGTSNFKTNLKFKKDGNLILLVEPLLFYLNELPAGDEIFKANFAISDKDSSTKIFYIHPTNIEKYKFPRWFRGCNSINDYHPTVKAHLLKHNLSLDIIESQTVEIITFKKLVEIYKITSIRQLQIDTEGHDHVILKNVLDYIKDTNFEISQIKFEWEPSFGNTEQLRNLINDAALLGYKDLGQNKNNWTISKL